MKERVSMFRAFTLAAFAAAAWLAGHASAAVNITPPNLAGANAGELPGRVSAGPNGAASFSTSFPVPPGTAGMAPAVGLTYSSQSGVGMMGLGWAITGQTQIARCAKTIATDGVKQPVKLDATDVFCLDGQRLILVPGTSNEYRTEIDAIGRITAIGGDAADGPASWKVEARSGLIQNYGTTTDSARVAPGKTARLSWALSKTEDRYGNYTTYHYFTSAASGEHYLTRIRYVGNVAAGLVPYNAINFVYETRPDPWRGYVAGSKLQRLVRLKAIEARINTASDGSGGTLKRQYQVAYTTSASSGRSLVQSLSDCDGSGNCLPATTFSWTPRLSAANTFQAAGSGVWGGPAVTFETDVKKYGSKPQQLPTKVQVGDFNGDGKADLLYGVGNGTWTVCTSTGAAFSCASWSGGPSTGKSEHVVVGDFNADGRSDFAMPPAASGMPVDWELCLSTGSAFTCSAAPAWNHFSTREPRQYLAVDINQDGRDDLMYQGNDFSGPKTFACMSTGSGFAPCANYGALNVFYPDAETQQIYYREYRATGDINGDGRADIINFGPGLFSDTDYKPYLANAERYSQAVHQTKSASQSMGADFGTTLVADSNGDGYADIHNGYYGARSETCYGTGDGAKLDCVLVDSTNDALTGAASVADYDGDGRPDVRIFDQVVQQQADGTRDHARSWTAPLAISALLLRADYNGDGLVDDAYYDEVGRKWTVSLTGSGSHPDLLSKVVSGQGLETRLEFKGLYDGTVYTRGGAAAYPKKNLTQGPPVVSRLLVSAVSGESSGQWLETNYTYVGLRTDLLGRGSLGFEKVVSTNKQTNVTTATTYSQDFPTVGLVLTEEAKHSNGTVLGTTTNTARYFSTIAGAYFPYVRQTVVTRKDLDGTALPSSTTLIGSTVSASDGIDAYGNVTRQTVTIVDGPDTFRSVSTNTFTNTTSTWLIGLHTDSSVTKSAPGVSNVTRKTRAGFNDKGWMISSVVEPDNTALKLETVYVPHATYGVTTKKTLNWLDPKTTTNKSRTVEEITAFDAKYRFPTEVKNAKGQKESRTFDEATGNMLTLTDVNLFTTSWGYDGWGRKLRESRPDSTSTTWSYKSCVDTCGYGSTAVAVTVAQRWAKVAGIDEQTTVPSETFFDAMGRQVLARSWNYAAEQILSDLVYDAKAQLHKSSRPHTLTDRKNNVISWETNTRDDLGRPTKVETPNPLGTGLDATLIDYSGSSTLTTNAKSQTRTEVVNGLGKLRSVTDANNKTTQFLYEPWGNLAQTTDPKGNLIVVTYDTLGRRTSLADPDLGTWTYKVDPLGQTFEQTDAKNQTTTYTFDDLGRMTDRLEPDQQSHWVYDTAARGVGKLAESYNGPATAKDSLRIHTYDALGRPEKIVTRLDWDYSTLFTYDQYGQIKDTLHRRNAIGELGGDSAQTYNFSYNNQGAVSQVKRNASTLLWSLNTQDELGRSTQETFGSGLVTRRSFNVWTGRLESIKTGTVDAKSVFTPSTQDDAYSYDSLGNLLTRSQLVSKTGAVVQDTFTYDSLNRLWTVKTGSGAVETLVYDDLGNLKTKPHVGTYTYPASGAASVRPHAVSSITGTVAGLMNPGFSYDGNGNLALGLNRGYQWSAANYPIKIDKLTNGTLASAIERTEFVYGPDRIRSKQTVRSMSGQTAGAVKRTIYYAGEIEKEFDASQNKTFIRTYLPLGLGYTQEEIEGAATPASKATALTHFFHKDHLGSISVMTGLDGNEQQRLSYDEWGRRRNLSGTDDAWTGLGTLSNTKGDRGYTGEEQLDQLGLVHLNGRVYDPMTARMVSADPTVPEPEDLQAWNRYSYVLNSPLVHVDPSGFAAAPPRQDDPLAQQPRPLEDLERLAQAVRDGLVRRISATGSLIPRYELTQKGSEVLQAAKGATPPAGAIGAPGGQVVSDADIDRTAGRAALWGAEKIDDFNRTELGHALQGLPPEGMALGGMKAGLLWLGRLAKVAEALPELKISASKYPELAENILQAQKAGHSNVLTHGGNAAANRAGALDGVPNIKGLSRDEYPFASSMQGGQGSWVGHVPASQQNAQGALIKNFVQQNGIKPGDQYRVVVVP